jgi:hypothetical protein
MGMTKEEIMTFSELFEGKGVEENLSAMSEAGRNKEIRRKPNYLLVATIGDDKPVTLADLQQEQD